MSGSENTASTARTLLPIASNVRTTCALSVPLECPLSSLENAHLAAGHPSAMTARPASRLPTAQKANLVNPSHHARDVFRATLPQTESARLAAGHLSAETAYRAHR